MAGSLANIQFSWRRGLFLSFGLVLFVVTAASRLQAQSQATSELREVLEQFSADREVLSRRYDASFTSERVARMQRFLDDQRARLESEALAPRSLEGAVDWTLLWDELEHQSRRLARERERQEELAPWLPFRSELEELHAARGRHEAVDGAKAAASIERLRASALAVRKQLESSLKSSKGDQAEENSGSTAESGKAELQLDPPSPHLGLAASEAAKEMLRVLDDWFEYHDGYDPLFSWWCRTPMQRARQALQAYEKVLREKVAGFPPAKDGEQGEDTLSDPIVGDPIGRAALLEELEHERIAYTPEELIEIAKRERDWCHARLREAARDMGLGDDWKAALEQVKQSYVEPGLQPELIRELSTESVQFLRDRDLMEIPELADEVWRMEMMSPQLQKVNPFFTGGEVISVSFPTDAMEHDDKLMSLRGNNRHFSRAVVHHELIPGHHLQGFMTRRYMPHRRAFGTPFWTEGWALYWELRLWDLGFAKSPQDRIGMLFWRMHRCARIVFSLSFHTGKMTAQECIDYLVEEVGHERANAEGEVRRSFNGSYEPLYQAAYLLGGLQLIALHKELVVSGAMSERVFHDNILRGGPLPIDLVRSRLLGRAPQLRSRSTWRFADG